MVLLVVDTQKGIVDERLYAFETFVSNIRELIRTAREQGIEVVYVQHDDGPGTGFSIGDDEFEVYSEFAPLPTERRFVKTVCSAFKKESGLLEYLTEKGEKDVMVCGIMTDFCINATVEAGFEHGLHMIVPAYANSTQDNEYMTGEQSYHYYNEFLWPDRYADCVPMDKALEQKLHILLYKSTLPENDLNRALDELRTERRRQKAEYQGAPFADVFLVNLILSDEDSERACIVDVGDTGMSYVIPWSSIPKELQEPLHRYVSEAEGKLCGYCKEELCNSESGRIVVELYLGRQDGHSSRILY